MPITQEKSKSKRGRQDPAPLSHQKVMRGTPEAARLEGKVQNLGIKNLGRQKKKPARPE